MPTVSYHSQFLNDGIHQQKTAQMPWAVYEDVAVEHSARAFRALQRNAAGSRPSRTTRDRQSGLSERVLKTLRRLGRSNHQSKSFPSLRKIPSMAVSIPSGV